VLHTDFCKKFGVEFPIVQTGMGWVAGASLAAATSAAGGLGIIASATMTYDEVVAAVAEVKRRTTKPFAVNMRADADDIDKRIDLLIAERVAVASFAQAPKQAIIKRCQDAGILVMPSIGAKRHAEKVLEWGVDAVLVQGAEGGGHTGAVPTSLLVPQVVDVVQGRVPVMAAGGYFDGRGLVSALAYGASGIAMGTRFLLTTDNQVPLATKKVYLDTPVNGTIVTTRVDGVPHRVLRTAMIDKMESTSAVAGLPRAILNANKFRKLSGLSWAALMREGLAMKKSSEMPWAGVIMAANTPILLKVTMVDGNPDGGVMASGQVVGLIDDTIENLPSVAEVIERVMSQAHDVLTRLGAE
jgi:NAD(P)H-dependent flavin oxidoreductase YrpB (nitropropane dioxygenase family)